MKDCIVCNNNCFSSIFKNTSNNSVVTSDNKILNADFELLQCNKCFHIQKNVTNDYIKTINNIYSNYDAYYLTNGIEEEKKDILEKDSNRSKIIIENLKDIIKENGKILDIGTGTGVFLKEFSKSYNWELYAQDVNNKEEKNLQKISKFKKLFILDEDKLYNKYFDIICAIHVFEHIIDLHSFLDTVKQSLKSTGILILQIPDICTNLYDLFIIDHVSHFSREVVYKVLKKHFDLVCFPKSQIYKEITIVATNNKLDFDFDNSLISVTISKNKIDKLTNFKIKKNQKLAVFGTSPAGLFCASTIDFNIEYFLDENSLKIDKYLYDKKIIHPKDANEDVLILFPYSKDVYDKIKIKYPNLQFLYIESSLA